MAKTKKTNQQLSKTSFIREFMSMINSPMLISEEWAKKLISTFSMYVRGEVGQELLYSFYDGGYYEDDDELSASLSNVAIIPVHGMLVNRSRWYSGSYDVIGEKVRLADKDDKIDTIVFDMQTPGGEAGGLFDLVDFIRDVGTRKKTIARVSDYALSAGYAIASACNEIICSRTSQVGSIGVVTTHASYEQMLKNNGIDITLIYSGDKKIQGNPYQSLSDSAVSDIQAKVNETYSMFVDTISTNMNLPRETVIATQGAVYSSSSALELKLVNKIESHMTTFMRLSTTQTTTSGNLTMSTIANPGQQQPVATVTTVPAPATTTVAAPVAPQQPQQTIANQPTATAPVTTTVAAVVPQPLDQGTINANIQPGGTPGSVAADALSVISACTAAGLASMAEGFIRSGLSMEQVKHNLETAGQVINCGKLLGVADEATKLALAGIDLETSRMKLTALASVDAQINNSVHPNTGLSGSGFGRHGDWDRAFANLNSAFGKQKQKA